MDPLDIPQVRNLLGCQFGRVVTVPGVDEEPCNNQAFAVVVIHDGPREVPLKLCEGHHAFVLSQTDEHK